MTCLPGAQQATVECDCGRSARRKVSVNALHARYAKSRLDPALRPEMYPTSAVVWHNRKGEEKGIGQRELRSVCRQNISDIRFGNLREYLAHLV